MSKESGGKYTIGYVVISLLLVAMMIFCIFLAIQIIKNGYATVFGRSAFRVVTGSMEPAIEVGEIIICRQTEAEELKVGDIISYRSPLSGMRGAIITHRIADIIREPSGAIAFETKGDANLTADPYYIHSDDIIGKMVWRSGDSFINRAIEFLTSRIGFLACIVMPVLLAAIIILKSAINNLCKEIKNAVNELAETEIQQASDIDLDSYSHLTEKDTEEIIEKLMKELTENAAKDKECGEER